MMNTAIGLVNPESSMEGAEVRIDCGYFAGSDRKGGLYLLDIKRPLFQFQIETKTGEL